MKRNIVPFVAGCAVGAFGILLYLQVSGQLAIRRRPVATDARSAGSRAHPAPAPYIDPATAPAGAVVIPVAGVRAEELRDSFTARRSFHTHGAIDIMAPRGTPVLAAVDGRIRKMFTSGDGGITIYETDPAETTMYYYAHLDRYDPSIHEGMAVTRGTVLGYVGTTGNAPANAPHLHFAVTMLPPTREWWKGDPIDPYPILVQHGFTVNAGRP